MGDDTDPSRIRSLAVSAEDVVDAFVYTRENPGTAVLRVTPPFHGRMRGRLHVHRVDDGRETGAVHVDPADLLADRVVERYPRLEDTRRRLAAESGGCESTDPIAEIEPIEGGERATRDGEGTDGRGDESADETDANVDSTVPPARVREAHAATLDSWRKAARSALVATTTIEIDGGETIELDVKRLG